MIEVMLSFIGLPFCVATQREHQSDLYVNVQQNRLTITGVEPGARVYYLCYGYLAEGFGEVRGVAISK
jgi:hypothetical protein